MKSKAAELVMESPDGKSQTEVNNNESIGIMEGLGWKVIGDAKPRKVVKKVEQEPDDETDPPAGKEVKTPKVEKTEKPDYDGMTKADLKELLDAKKIDYDNHATKADLIELLGTK